MVLPLSAFRALVLRVPLRILRFFVDISRLLPKPFPVSRRSWMQWQRRKEKGGRRTLVIGSLVKEMRFRPQRRTDSVVICGRMELLIRNSRICLKLGGLCIRINEEILKLVYRKWNKKAHVPDLH